ncbi:MAG: hypothetical protein LBS25_04055 [Candidatus Symbiothrix sp.]|jgi:hypothetical protein|nr:hypothetical protein [Candidatus Symbiothrix sp.]
MKKIFVLLSFVLIGLGCAAAGPYYCGLNQLQHLLDNITESNFLDTEGNEVILPATSKTDDANWGKIGGVTWTESMGGSNLGYFTDDKNNYMLISSIDWSGTTYSYHQKDATTIAWVSPTQNDIDNKYPNTDILQGNDLRWLTSINLSGNDFKNISIVGNDRMILNTVNLSNNPTLQSLSITGCPELESVNITGCELSFAEVETILNNVTMKSGYNVTYTAQGTISMPVDAVDLNDLLTACGENTTVVSWSETWESSSENVYVFDESLVGQSLTVTLANSNYSEVGNLQYTVNLTGSTATAVSFSVNSPHGNVSWAPEYPAINESVTITVTPATTWWDITSFTVDDTPVVLDANNQYTFTPNKNSYNLTVNYSGFGGTGAGDAGSPYIITNERQLNQVRNALTAQYQLGNDISLVDAWSPITDFEGKLDGNYHIISELTINTANNENGLFGTTKGNVEIKNLGLTGVDITGKAQTGGLIGEVKSGTTSIQSCFVSGNIYGSANVGGLVGKNSASLSITNCYVTGEVDGNNTGDRVGGIVGMAEATCTIDRCYSLNSVYNHSYGAGGFVGSKNGGTLTISNSAAINTTIKGNNDTHRLVGWKNGGDSDFDYTNNFAFANTLVNNNVITDGAADNVNGLDKTALQLRTQSTYETDLDWDFDAVWTMGNGNYRLPVLQSFASAAQSSDYVSHLPIEATWKSDAASTDIADADNWDALPVFPDEDIIVSYNASNYYPALTASTAMANVTLRPGAGIVLDNHQLSATSIKAQQTVTAKKWYAIGFPFNVTSIYSEHYEDNLDAGINFWMKSFDGADFPDVSNNTLPASGQGYIIEFPSDFAYSSDISYISGAISNLVKGELSFTDDAYELQANPTLAPLAIEANTLPTDQYIYQLNSAGTVYALITGSATIAPFESVVTYKEKDTPHKASINTDAITGISTIIEDDVVIETQYYNLQGMRIPKVETGQVRSLPSVAGNLYIVKEIHKSGKTSVYKSIIQ